jgi:hypothetical protein
MRIPAIWSVWALILAVCGRTAFAFVNAPILIPDHPTAGRLVSISVTAGLCNLMGGAPPEVATQGNNIHVLLQSAHSIDNEFCTFPTLATTYAIGQFAPGSYTMQVDRTFIGSNGPVTETIGVIVFDVAALASAPTLSQWGLLLLFLVVAGSARGALLQRPRSPERNLANFCS